MYLPPPHLLPLFFVILKAAHVNSARLEHFSKCYRGVWEVTHERVLKHWNLVYVVSLHSYPSISLIHPSVIFTVTFHFIQSVWELRTLLSSLIVWFLLNVNMSGLSRSWPLTPGTLDDTLSSLLYCSISNPLCVILHTLLILTCHITSH